MKVVSSAKAEDGDVRKRLTIEPVRGGVPVRSSVKAGNILVTSY
jgi:hypothetical protein